MNELSPELRGSNIDNSLPQIAGGSGEPVESISKSAQRRALRISLTEVAEARRVEVALDIMRKGSGISRNVRQRRPGGRF